MRGGFQFSSRLVSIALPLGWLIGSHACEFLYVLNDFDLDKFCVHACMQVCLCGHVYARTHHGWHEPSEQRL